MRKPQARKPHRLLSQLGKESLKKSHQVPVTVWECSVPGPRNLHQVSDGCPLIDRVCHGCRKKFRKGDLVTLEPIKPVEADKDLQVQPYLCIITHWDCSQSWPSTEQIGHLEKVEAMGAEDASSEARETSEGKEKGSSGGATAVKQTKEGQGTTKAGQGRRTVSKRGTRTGRRKAPRRAKAGK